MTAERIAGGWCISAIVRGYLVTRRYLGFTKRTALYLFRTHEIDNAK